AGRALATVEAFDPTTRAWSARPSLAAARPELAAAELNGKLYVLGGWSGASPSAEVETTAGVLYVHMLR
ncbi:MAG TPA: hypothetical protein PKD53_17110, partial [Chloroflexaceae bacterium]|nr:hypothetical protein [Chloroflexaceae bacterium]